MFASADVFLNCCAIKSLSPSLFPLLQHYLVLDFDTCNDINVMNDSECILHYIDFVIIGIPLAVVLHELPLA